MSLSFTTLSTEIQHQCLSFCNFDDLRSTRLLNHSVKNISTELLFRIVKLLPTDASSQKFINVAKTDTLNRHIRKVVVHTDKNPERRLTDGGKHDRSKKRILEYWADAMKLIPRFTNATEVELTFAVDCGYFNLVEMYIKDVPETMEFRTQVLNAFFQVLNRDSRINSLSIKHLQDATEGVYETEDFQVLRSRLKQLHLQVTTEHVSASPGSSIELPECHQFFNYDLNIHWLRPMQQLTHMTLYSLDYWGVYPRWDITNLHFPNLMSLALGKYTFMYDWQIEWILSHESTLKELSLCDCPIVFAARMKERQYMNLPRQRGLPLRPVPSGCPSVKKDIFPTIRWYTVFTLFSTHLTELKRFAMAEGHWDADIEKAFPFKENRVIFENRNSLPTRLDSPRYCIFDCDTAPSAWIHYDPRHKHGRGWDCGWVLSELEDGGKLPVQLEYPDCKEEDSQALEEFMLRLGRK